MRVRPHRITVRFGTPLLPGKRGTQTLDSVVKATRQRMEQMLDVHAENTLPADRGGEGVTR